MRIAIVGAGVAGLGSAIVLARAGHDVTLLERDATPLPATPEEAFSWRRRGAPQVRHSHAFLARMRNLLRDRLPDVRQDLLDAGATEVAWSDMLPDTLTDRTPEPGDEDLVMLCCRRTTFEWVLRRAALRTERVELRDGVSVTGLSGKDGAGSVRITGLRTDAGEVRADLVVDATGRPSHTPRWLRELGVDLDEAAGPTGIVYLSRFYRLREGAEPPNALVFNGADLQYLKYAVFRGDNRSFSVTLACGTEDDELRFLRERPAFEAAARALPAVAEWVDPERSEPISEVTYMGGLINRVRRYVVGDEPLVEGLAAVGDASVCTNPLYGQGCSLAMVHALELAEAMAEGGDSLRSLALSFDARTQRELVPWYVASRQQDAVSIQVQRGEELTDFNAFMRSLVYEGVFPATRSSAVVSRAWFRTFNLLTPPDGLMTNSEAMPVIMRFWEERERREAPEPVGPPRDRFLELVGKDV